MRKNRKCDTTKYRKRRVKEKVAHAIRVERRKKEEIAWGRIQHKQRERVRLEREQKSPLVQKMVNLLAKNILRRILSRLYSTVKKGGKKKWRRLQVKNEL